MSSSISVAGAVFILLIGAVALAQGRRAGTGERHSFTHGDRERAYRIHVPRQVANGKRPVPLVVCFHGGGGTAEVASRMGWTPLADEEG